MNEKLNSLLYVVGISLMIALIIPTCSRPATAEKILIDQGYTNIKTTGWAPLSKGEDDWWSTSFEATNSNGVQVEGVISGGMFFKGSTVRFK